MSGRSVVISRNSRSGVGLNSQYWSLSAPTASALVSNSKVPAAQLIAAGLFISTSPKSDFEDASGGQSIVNTHRGVSEQICTLVPVPRQIGHERRVRYRAQLLHGKCCVAWDG